MEKIAIYIDEGLIKKLRTLKEKTGIPVSESIRRAIKEYLENKSK